MSHKKGEDEYVKEFLESLDDKDAEEGLAGLEELQFSEIETLSDFEEQEIVSDKIKSKENIPEEMEIEELPMDDGGNPEIDQDLLRELTEDYFRESLDVDMERAQKGITSAGERTIFGERIKGSLEKVNEVSDEDTDRVLEISKNEENEQEQLEETSEYENLEVFENEQDEESITPEKDQSIKRSRKSESKPEYSLDENEPEGFYEEEKDSDIVESYYQNLGKTIEDSPPNDKNLDDLLEGNRLDDTWDSELENLSYYIDEDEERRVMGIVGLSHSRDMPTENGIKPENEVPFEIWEQDWVEELDNVTTVLDEVNDPEKVSVNANDTENRYVSETSNQALNDDEAEWQEFLNQNVYSNIDEDVNILQKMPWLFEEENTEMGDHTDKYEDTRESSSFTPVQVIALRNEQKQSDHSKDLDSAGQSQQDTNKFVREFNQGQDDAQKDYENAIWEAENGNSIDSIIAAAASQAFKNQTKNNEKFFREIHDDHIKGFREKKSNNQETFTSGKRIEQKGSQSSGRSKKDGWRKENSGSNRGYTKDNTWDDYQRQQSGTGSNGTERDFKDDTFQFDDGIFASIYPSTKTGKNLRKRTLRELETLGRYGVMYAVSSIQGNATVDGLVLMGRTFGTYVLSPTLSHLTKQAARVKTREMIRRMNNSDKYKFLHDPTRMGQILKPFVKNKYGEKYREGMERAYLNPTRPKQILEMKYWLDIHLKDKEIPTDPKLLKKMLKKDRLSKTDAELIKVYLQLDKISKMANKAKFRPIKMLRKGYNKVKFTVKTQAKRSASQNDVHLLAGLFLANKYAKIAIKVAYRTFRTAVKAAKFLIPRIRRTKRKVSAAVEKFTAGRAPQKAMTAPDEKTGFKTAKKSKTKKILLKSGSSISGEFKHGSERLTKDSSTRAAEKAEKVAQKAAATAVKVTAKLTKKAIIAIVKIIVHIISLIASLLGPIAVVAIICFVVFFSFKSLFDLDKGTYYEAVEQSEKTEGEKSASNEKNVQQYADVLDECRKEFKKNMEEIYEFDEFETISVTYQERKKNGVTKIYEESAETSNDIVTGDNTKEIIAMTCTLFDLNLEDYVTDDEDYGWFGDALNLTRTTEKDEAKLEDFFVKLGLDPKLGEKTNYKKLIRSYLMALYNGSHTATKMIEETHCSGCVATEEIIQDENGDFVLDAEGNPTYVMECPGHKHLYITVTTYYFDDIFGCELKQKNDLVEIIKELKRDTTPDVSLDAGDIDFSGSIDVSGSNTVEKLWNGLKSQGYTDEATAGIIGNLMWESGGGPTDVKLNAVQTGGSGIGMCQWSNNLDGSGGRREQFLNFISQPGRNINNASDQLEFMLYELQNGQWLWPTGSGYTYDPRYNIPLAEFKNCTDIRLATGAFCAKFERCFTSNAHLEERISYAQNVYNSYHGKQSSRSG